MSEHHDSKEFDAFRRSEDIIRCRGFVGVVGGGEDDKGKFPNGGPLYAL